MSQRMTTIKKINEVERRESYKQGYLQALNDWAWWKDGVQYVGGGGNTLKQAQEDFELGVSKNESFVRRM